MKWILLVVGSHPVETDDSLDTCLKAEETMRKEYARVQPGHLGYSRRRGEETGQSSGSGA